MCTTGEATDWNWFLSADNDHYSYTQTFQFWAWENSTILRIIYSNPLLVNDQVLNQIGSIHAKVTKWLCACVLSRFSCVRLFATLWTVACRLLRPWGSPGKNAEGLAMPSSRGPSWPRDQTCVSYVSFIGRWVLYHQHHLGSPEITRVLLIWCHGEGRAMGFNISITIPQTKTIKYHTQFI